MYLSVFKHNIHQIFICIDQLLNAVICTVLEPKKKVYGDETLSSHSWRWHVSGIRSWPKILIDKLFFWQEEHCKDSFESERLGRHLPPEARG